MVKYIDQLHVYRQSASFHILSVNGTRLDGSIDDNEIGIDDYDIVRKDRNRNGGGVAFYIKNTLNYEIRDNLLIPELEILSVEMKHQKCKPDIITTWCRPPNSSMNFFDKFETLLQKLEDENIEYIFMGDFNCNLLSNNILSPHKSFKGSSAFLSVDK